MTVTSSERKRRKEYLKTATTRAFRAIKETCDHAGHYPISTIRKAVAASFGISCEELLGTRKIGSTVEARHIAMALACHLTELSFKQIALQLNRNDHTTVRNAKTKFEPLLLEIECSLAQEAPGPERKEEPERGVSSVAVRLLDPLLIALQERGHAMAA